MKFYSIAFQWYQHRLDMARWDVWTHVVGFGRRVWGLIFVDHKFFNWLLIWGDVGTLDIRKLHCQANFEPRKLQGDSRVVQGRLPPAQPGTNTKHRPISSSSSPTKIGIGWSIVRLVVLFRSLPPQTKIEIYWGLSSQWHEWTTFNKICTRWCPQFVTWVGF